MAYTLTSARARLAEIGYMIRKDADGEYRVNRAGSTEATAYYTTDLADAVATAEKDRDFYQRNPDLSPRLVKLVWPCGQRECIACATDGGCDVARAAFDQQHAAFWAEAR